MLLVPILPLLIFVLYQCLLINDDNDNDSSFVQVLSHRFGHWVILQNSCIHLWNTTKQLLELFPPPLPLSNNNSLPLPMAYEELLKIITRTMFIASNCLLDMLIILKRNGTCYNKERNWKFEFMRDDGSTLNLKFVEKFVLRSIEMLCIGRKWEKAIDISLKLNAINGSDELLSNFYLKLLLCKPIIFLDGNCESLIYLFVKKNIS